jgi:hypothetical protein
MTSTLQALLDEVEYILSIDYDSKNRNLELSKTTVDTLRGHYERYRNHDALWETLEIQFQHLHPQIKSKFESLYASGAINPEDFTNNHELADLLLTAALQDIVAKRLHVASNKTRKELKNLAHF